jgi:hypothetical protein
VGSWTTYAAIVALALSVALPASASPIPSQTLNVGGASIQIDFGEGKFDLPISTILTWVETCAKSVTTYYGRFPVARARILILPVADKRGVRQGTTWGNLHGFPAFTRIRLGERTTTADLAADWTLTHELIHTAFPDLPDDQHWLEEGLATYIEPIARAQNGQLPISQVWDGMMQGMPNGEPEEGDRGLDRTHTWGRTYWGGAMFCLMADIAIHRQTDNRQGLQDAVRAIVNAGGGIDKDWPLPRTLEIGDRATNTTVLTDLYRQWSTTPSQVDLTDLWSKLGVRSSPNGVILEPNAPWAKIREAITTPRPISASR